MRILLITETAPYPLDSGGRIKTWHTLTALAREHEVHCHAFVRHERQRADALGPLAGICASVTLHLEPRSVPREVRHLLSGLSTNLPFTVVRHFSPAAMQAVATACRAHDFDLVYCDHLSMLEYGRRLDVPIVHDAHNVEHRVVARYAASHGAWSPKRLLLDREARAIEHYERAMYPPCALILTVSEVDATVIRAFAPDVPVVSVPIAVAASELSPVATLTSSPDVLFVGALDWPPNADAVHYLLSEIWPAVVSQVPEARLTVVGRSEAGLKARWGKTPSVRFTGWVDDVEPWFRQSRVMMVPIRAGSGMRVKILDAFARGIPVVATATGIEGIGAVDGVDALIADDALALADATARLLLDAPLAARIAKAARSLALERYDKQKVGDLQLAAIRRLAPRAR
jgi:polysaccharide biosynthesis protein PslH